MNDDVMGLAEVDADAVVDQADVSTDLLENTILALYAVKDRITILENTVSELKRQRDELARGDIPSLMNKLGLVSSDGKGTFEMPDGAKVHLRTDEFVAVAAAHMGLARKWLIEHGHEDCIKYDLSSTKMKRVIKQLAEEETNIAEVLTVPTGNPAAPTAPVFKVWNQVSAVVTGRKEN